MAERVKKIRVKQADGTMSDYIPLGANAADIDLKNGNNLEAELMKISRVYDCVIDMKEDISLKNGMIVSTLGYYYYNDGGNATYRIIDSTNADFNTLIEDGGSVHILHNGLKAILIVEDGRVNVKQFGAQGNGEHDDTENIQKALNFCNTTEKKVCYLPIGTFITTQALKVLDDTKLTGAHTVETVVKKVTNNKCNDGSDYNDYDAVIILDTKDLQGTTSGLHATVEHLLVQGNIAKYQADKTATERQYGILALHPVPKTYITNFQIRDVDVGIQLQKMWTGWIENAEIMRCAYRAIYVPGETQGITIRNINTQWTHEVGIEINGTSYSNLISCLVEWIYGGTAYRLGSCSANLSGCGYEVGNGVKIGFDLYKAKTTLTSGYFFSETPDDGDDNNYMFILDQSNLTIKNSTIGRYRGSVADTEFNGSFAYLKNGSHLTVDDDTTWHCRFKKPIEYTSTSQNESLTIKDRTIFLAQRRVAMKDTWSRAEKIDSNVNPNGGEYLAKNIYLDNVTSPYYVSTSENSQEWQPAYNKGDILTINNPKTQGQAFYICDRSNQLDFPEALGTVVGYASGKLTLTNIQLENYDKNGIRWYKSAPIYGMESGAIAYVSTWDYEANTLTVSSRTGDFIPGEKIRLGKGPNSFLRQSSWSVVPIINAEKTILRPTDPIAGQMFFDLTLNKPIWFNGSKWVDSVGAEV